MKILILYQDVQSGSKVATEAIIKSYKNLFHDSLIIYKQKPRKLYGRFSFTINLIWSIYDFRKIIQKASGIDCIYSTMYTYAVAQLFSKNKNIQSIYHIHGDQKFGKNDYSNFSINKYYAKFLGNIILWLQCFAIKKASLVCFVSNSAKLEFLKAYGLQKYSSKIRIIPNGVNLSIFKPVSIFKKQKLKNKYGCSNKHILLYVGRIDEKKGIHLLIKSLKYIRNYSYEVLIVYAKYYDCYANLYFKYLQHLANSSINKIRFLKSPQKIQELYQIADCVILPSQQEMMPLVILEALACGTPVICTSKIWKPYMNIKKSFLFKKLYLPNISCNSIAKSIRVLQSTPLSDIKSLSNKGLTLVQNFTWQKSTKILNSSFLEATQCKVL